MVTYIGLHKSITRSTMDTKTKTKKNKSTLTAGSPQQGTIQQQRFSAVLLRLKYKVYVSNSDAMLPCSDVLERKKHKLKHDQQTGHTNNTAVRSTLTGKGNIWALGIG